MIYREKNNIKGCILYDEVEERPLKLLKQLIDVTGAKVVVSSTWRYGCAKLGGLSLLGDKLFNKLESALHTIGVDIFDVTPVLSDGQRGDEIRQWLLERNNVESFVILDDDSDMCEFTETNLVKTTYKHGLCEEHIKKAIKILNKL